MSPGGRIKDSDIETVRDRTDLVQLISEYVPLKKSGSQFRGPCPFHQEKDPSFYVSPTKNVYYCHGCKASGSTYQFIQQIDGLSFREAVEKLADRIGYRLTFEAASPEDDERRAARDRLGQLNRTAADYYHHVLVSTEAGAPAREYLASRKLDEAVIEEFQLGFALPQWDGLSTFLAKKGYTEGDIARAGLARERGGQRRGIYDIFRNRVIFPIIDHRGRAVAFGGRLLPGEAPEGEPKYLNSPETPIYHKGRVLYGFYQARSAIQEAAEAVVVEGYTDLLALWNAGVRDVVATLGTALTENHFELLGRICDRVYLAFDADRAGKDAATRALEFFGRFRFEVFVVLLPEGQDPASMIEDGGAEAFEAVKLDARTLIDFVTRRRIAACDTSTPMGRRRAMEACVPILSKVSGEDMLPVRNDLVRKIGGWLEMPEQTVEVYLREASRTGTGRGQTASETRDPVRWDKVEREALGVLLQDPDAFIEHQYLDTDYFTDPRYKNIFALLKEICAGDEEKLRAGYDNIVGRMVEGIGDEDLRATAAGLIMETPPQCAPGYEDKVFDRLGYMFYRRRKREKEQQVRTVDKHREPKKYDALLTELFELEQVIKEQFPYDHR